MNYSITNGSFVDGDYKDECPEDSVDTLIMNHSRSVVKKSLAPKYRKQNNGLNIGQLPAPVRMELSRIQRDLGSLESVSKETLADCYKSVMLAALNSGLPGGDVFVEQRDYMHCTLTFYQNTTPKDEAVTFKRGVRLADLVRAARSLGITKRKDRTTGSSELNENPDMLYLASLALAPKQKFSGHVRESKKFDIDRDYYSQDLLNVCEPAIGAVDQVFHKLVKFSGIKVYGKPLTLESHYVSPAGRFIY